MQAHRIAQVSVWSALLLALALAVVNQIRHQAPPQLRGEAQAERLVSR